MAMILDAFVGNCIHRLAPFVEEQVILVLGVKDELERLQARLRRIRCVLKDAERRRIEEEAVHHWLNELKGVIYEADDLLDLCRLEGGRLLEEEEDQPSNSSVRCHFPLLSCFTSVPFRHNIGSSIKKLNVRLDEILKDNLMITLEQTKHDKDDDDIGLGGVNPRQTSPLDEFNVVGRDIKEATNKLVELLVGEEKQKCRVFAIVGMGGIGKTTLAQKLYNEPRIDNNFQVRVWVCISQTFSEINLLKQIIKSAGGSKDEDAGQTKAELLPKLKTLVSGKRLFLVLDDVWGAEVWVDLLQNPLQSGAASCSIIVTTRDENVARMMRAVYVHRVEELPVESGWELLRNKVFIEGEEEEEMHTLTDVGIQIVEKCHGLPLAIKTIAGVLSAKGRTREEWEKVLKSNAWSMSQLPKELSGALYLSYENLPSHLKQCFLYLSMFPEDYGFYMLDFVPLWIAEGLVETHGNSLEDTAEEYFRELVKRSLLQPSFDEDVCSMHDLLRSLGLFLSQNECFSVYGEVLSTSTTSEFRRLSFTNVGEETLLTGSIKRQKHLRTLLLIGSPLTINNDLISRLRHLRVLLINCHGFDCVPDSIGDLIHLRYINLDCTAVSELPDSVGRLRNLQMLSVRYCRYLHTLPEGITRLCSLRRLRIQDSPVNYVPKGIGKLHQLNHIEGIVLGDDDSIAGKPQKGCDLKDLQYISQLRFLSMRRLERASTTISALQSKSYLKILHLYCSPHTDRAGQQPYTEEDMEKIEEIFNELRPPPCIKKLLLDGYFGRSYPSWMSTASLPQVSEIKLKDFLSCEQVPALGELPQLRIIEISRAYAVVSIGPEFTGAGVRKWNNELISTAFPKLEFLSFESMANWEEWSLGREADQERAAGKSIIENRSLVLFPHLKELVLDDCPKLRALPQGLEHAISLQKLFIRGADSLSTVEDLPSLSELRLIDNSSLERVSGLPALKLLLIRNCSALRIMGSLNALQRLSLTDTEMECVPQWLIELLQQRLQAENIYFLLELWCNVRVLQRCLKNGPDWPIIRQIPQVNVNTTDREAYMYYTKEPSSYTTNLSGSQDPNLDSLGRPNPLDCHPSRLRRPHARLGRQAG